MQQPLPDAQPWKINNTFEDTFIFILSLVEPGSQTHTTCNVNDAEKDHFLPYNLPFGFSHASSLSDICRPDEDTVSAQVGGRYWSVGSCLDVFAHDFRGEVKAREN